MAIYPEAGNGGTAEMARRIDMTQIKVFWKFCGRGAPKSRKRSKDSWMSWLFFLVPIHFSTKGRVGHLNAKRFVYIKMQVFNDDRKKSHREPT